MRTRNAACILRRACAALAWVGVFNSAPVLAQALTLDALYRIAHEHDATVQAARHAELAAAQRLPLAQAQGMPQVILSADRLSNRLDMVSRQDQYNSSNSTFQIRQPLLRLGLGAALEQARQAEAEARAQRTYAQQELLVRLSTSLFEHLLALEQRTLILALKQAAAQQLQAAERSLQAGSGVRTDVDEARARWHAARAQELQFQLQVDATRRQLERLCGRPLGELAGLTPEDPWSQEPALGELQEWLDRTLEHPQLQAMRARVEAARHEVSRVQTNDTPTIDAVARWTQSRGENVFNPNGNYRNHQLGVQLNWPLYQGGATQAAIREALARLDEAEQRLRATQDELAQKLEIQFKVVQEGRLRIEALRQSVYSAEQARISSERSFAAGSRSRLDVLNAEQALEQARRELTQGRLSYLLAQLQLGLQAGNLPEQALLRVLPWFSVAPTRR